MVAYILGAVSTFYNPEWIVPALFGLIVSMAAYVVVYCAAALMGIKLGYRKIIEAEGDVQ